MTPAYLPTAVALVFWRETPCAPTARDRVLASSLGAAAVKALLDNRGGYTVGEINREIAHTHLKDTWEKQMPCILASLICYIFSLGELQ